MFGGVHQKYDPLTGLAITLVQKVLVKKLLWGSRDVVQLHVPNLLLVDCVQPFQLATAGPICHHYSCGVGGIAVDRL